MKAFNSNTLISPVNRYWRIVAVLSLESNILSTLHNIQCSPSLVSESVVWILFPPLTDPVQTGLSSASLWLPSNPSLYTPLQGGEEKSMAALHSSSAPPIHLYPATATSYRRRRLCLRSSAVSSAPKARFIARRSDSASVKQLQRPLGTSVDKCQLQAFFSSS